MSVDVEQFLENLSAKNGKFSLWEPDIFKLYRAQVSYQSIAEFLNANGVKATKMEVYRFIHRKKRSHLRGDAASTNPAVIAAASPQFQTVSGGAHVGGPPQGGTDLPKFSWRQSRTKDEPKW